MWSGAGRLLRLLVATALLVLAPVAAGAPGQGRTTVDPSAVARLLQPELEQVPLRMVRLGEPEVTLRGVTWPVHGLEDDSRVAAIHWRADAGVLSGRPRWGGVVDLQLGTSLPEVQEDVLRLVEAAWSVQGPAEMEAVEMSSPEPLRLKHPWLLGLSLLLAGWKLLRHPPTHPRVQVDLRLLHLLPVAIQGGLYTYWALYFPPVVWYLPALLVQIGLAYAIDALLAFGHRGTWRIGAGPIPVVLSLNLFAWYVDAGKASLALLVALSSKYWFAEGSRFRLNPSGVGLAFMGLAYLLAPQQASFDGVVHHLALAPHMVELIVALALIAQLRLPLALMSIGGLLGLMGIKEVVDGLHLGSVPGLVLPSTVLAFALLVTEPRSAARSGAGRLAQGLVYGVSVGLCTLLYQYRGLGDDFGKVLFLPVVNLLGPWLDDRLAAVRWPVLEAGRRRLHAAVWVVLVMAVLWRDKPHAYFRHDHWRQRTPVVTDATGWPPSCDEGALGCRPLQLGREIEGWWRRSRAGDDARQSAR